MFDAADGLKVKSHVARDLLQNAVLFKTDKLAVWEYVVNSLQYVDAGVSPRIKVTLDSKKKKIVVSDNGKGMDWAGLQNFFIMHGENIDRKEGRPGRGRFGTGKSAAFGIGRMLTITTVRNGKRYKVRLERTQIEAMNSGDEIPVETIEREIRTNEISGTIIEIDGIYLKSLDQAGIIRYIERHLARWPKNATIFVNNHECEYQEPPIAEEIVFRPEGELTKQLGDVQLLIKISKSPIEEDLKGISIYSNGVWYETTLAGSEGKEMSQFIFGDIDIPKLDEDTSPIPPFDLTRSMRLNPENNLVQAIYAFVGQKVDLVRRDLVEKNKKRKESEEAKKLEKQAAEIASLINADFDEFRQKLAKVKAKAPGGTDLRDVLEDGVSEDALIGGEVFPAEVISDTGDIGHGDGMGGHGGEPPDLGKRLRPVENGDKLGKSARASNEKRKPKGGFNVKFDHLGEESPRAQYFRDERTIFINIDHPQLVAARGLESTEEIGFKRLSYEVAFTEYAIALASELAARDEYLDPSDPIVDIRDTINRLARKGASLYSLDH